jgi:uncharacterized LabA/DUF88 family protein
LGKNVAVFVDVANIFYAAKAAGVDIDYVTLLRSATAGRDFVRAYAYTGLDPENENQRNFHQFLARHSYKVVSKDIRKYGDGKVKANLDIELVVDLMKTARNLDIAVIVSGDGDFASAIRAVQEMGVRVEVVSFRGNTSSDLIDVADLFTDITQIAKVEKGSTRSGRRVTEDEEDLSMTEVPDKQSEGTGEGRGRGRGRTTRGGRGRGDRDVRDRERDVREEPAVAAASSGGRGLTALPGEKLSKVAASGGDAEVAEDEELDLASAEVFDGEPVDADGETDGDGRRRRRRRGGRGRGRGRAREEGGEALEDEPREAAPAAAAAAAPAPSSSRGRDRDRELPTPFDEPDEPAPRRQPATPFGSVWDRQVGVPAARPAADLEPLPDEDFDEPAIPEYLIAERRGNRPGGQRAGGGGQRGGGRGRGGAYAAAIERERYGRGGGSSFNRYPEPARGGTGGGGGANRDRSYGGGGGGRDRDRDRDRAPQGRPSGGGRGSSDPWSEVPPELEELVRAQMARSKPSGEARPVSDVAPAATPPEGEEDAVEAVAAPARARGRTRRTTAAEAAPVAEATPAVEATPKRRTTTRKSASAATSEAPVADDDAAPAAAPKRRTTTRKTAATADAAADAVPSDVAVTTPARRTRRTSTAATADAATTATPEAVDAAAAPKRRTTRKPATASTEG